MVALNGIRPPSMLRSLSGPLAAHSRALALLPMLIALAASPGPAFAGSASVSPPAWDQGSALGEPIGPGETPNCPVTRGVFVREEDKARFVADHYGVNVNVRLSELNEVLSGLLDGHRAYLFAMHASPGTTGATSSSWKDNFYPRHASEGPFVSTISAPIGPLRGSWILTECRS